MNHYRSPLQRSQQQHTDDIVGWYICQITQYIQRTTAKGRRKLSEFERAGFEASEKNLLWVEETKTLGCGINSKRIIPTTNKTDLINHPEPKNQKQLKSYLAAKHHISKFISTSSKTHCL